MSVLYYPKLNYFLNLLMQKIGLPHVQDNKSLAQGVTYEYSIADFLVDVKSVFDDTFSNDVYKKLGVRRATTDFPANLIYSKRKLYDERMNMRLTSEERRFGKVEVPGTETSISLPPFSRYAEIFAVSSAVRSVCGQFRSKSEQSSGTESAFNSVRVAISMFCRDSC